jgi:hypothetical protein
MLSHSKKNHEFVYRTKNILQFEPLSERVNEVMFNILFGLVQLLELLGCFPPYFLFKTSITHTNVPRRHNANEY